MLLCVYRDKASAAGRTSVELLSSGIRCTVPSSFTSSQSTPADGSPASVARSTAASVWTAALSSDATGPARSGNTLPGLHQLFGPGPRIGENPDRLRAILGADARRDPFRGVDADGEIRAMRLPVLAHHRAEGEAFEAGVQGWARK